MAQCLGIGVNTDGTSVYITLLLGSRSYTMTLTPEEAEFIA